jgi:hypothetical protein
LLALLEGLDRGFELAVEEHAVDVLAVRHAAHFHPGGGLEGAGARPAGASVIGCRNTVSDIMAPTATEPALKRRRRSSRRA